MHYHPPTYKYSGLSVVVGKPGRHDSKYLAAGYSGDYFSSCLKPLDRFSCELREAIDPRPRLEGTKVVLLTGEESLHLIKPGANILHHRGSPIVSNDLIFIPTIGIQDAYDRQNYESEDEDESDAETEAEKDYQKTNRRNFRFWLRKDIQKAVRILRSGLRVHPQYNITTYPNPELITSTLLGAIGKVIVIDIETDRHRNITCFGFTIYDPLNPNDISIFVVPVKRYTNTLAYDILSLARIFRALAICFGRNLVVVHNGGFDLTVLSYKYLIPLPPNVDDTMLMQHRCYPEVEKSLGHIVSQYLDLPFHKDEGIFEPKSSQQEAQLWNYNAKDVYTTLLCWLELKKEVALRKAEESARQACKSLRPYITMSVGGAKVDTERMLRLYNSYASRKDQIQRVLTLMVGQPLNPRSSKQVSKYLYEYLKLPQPDDQPTGELTLIKLYIKYGLPSIRLILEARGAGKMASSLKFKLWKDSRFTCSWKVGKTDTFRLGSSALFKFRGEKGFGGNFQNWNKKLRPCIVADDGCILGQNDQSGAEALVVAYLCPDGRFRQLFLNKIKPHTYVAMHLVAAHWATLLGLPDIDDYLNCPIPLLTKMKYWADLKELIALSDDDPDAARRYYYVAKQACHSLNYDATWIMFQLNTLLKTEGVVRLPDQEAKRIHNLYRNIIFPEIHVWHQDVQMALETNGRVLTNLFGHPRFFGDFWGRELFKKAYAFIPQSTIGPITNVAITELSDRCYEGDQFLKEAGFQILANGHDSILWQSYKEYGLKCASIVKSHIERELTSFRGEKFRMGSEAQLGYNWGVKSEKNSMGLEEIDI